MRELITEKGFLINTGNFAEIDEVRMDLTDKVVEIKEQLSYQKCALLLNDLLYSAKLNMPLYDYVKRKYNIRLDFVEKGAIISSEEITNYIFYIFTELNQKVERDRASFNFDMLDDFDLSCRIHFYPFVDKTLFLVNTRQNEYLDVMDDHLSVEPYCFDVDKDEPPSNISYQRWAERAKDWLSVINRCGGGENWVPSAGGFTVDLTENSFFIPDFEQVNKYFQKIHNDELETMLDAMLQRGE